MFRELSTYTSILRESSFVGVAAIGMTFCIITGDFDLSVGSMLSLLGIAIVAIISGRARAGARGRDSDGRSVRLFNGLLVSRLRIPPS